MYFVRDNSQEKAVKSGGGVVWEDFSALLTLLLQISVSRLRPNLTVFLVPCLQNEVLVFQGSLL